MALAIDIRKDFKIVPFTLRLRKAWVWSGLGQSEAGEVPKLYTLLPFDTGILLFTPSLMAWQIR